MDTIKIAVCEDEDKEYNRLTELLSDCKYNYTIERFNEGQALLDKYYPYKYNLILMDIYMEGLGGIDTVAKIRTVDKMTTIAFTTTSLDHALDGYKHHVNRYLVKPFAEEDLMETIELAYNEMQNIPSISVTQNNKDVNIPFTHIRYMEQIGKDISLYLMDEIIVKPQTKISDLLKILPKPPFYQSHKSFVVNLTHVKYLNKELNVFEMNGGGNVYIRRDSLKEAETTYKDYMFELVRKGMDE